jgi:hypothetical protein
MICPPCARAADQQLPRTAHCTDPKCMCGHRTDSYRQPATKEQPTGE